MSPRSEVESSENTVGTGGRVAGAAGRTPVRAAPLPRCGARRVDRRPNRLVSVSPIETFIREVVTVAKAKTSKSKAPAAAPAAAAATATAAVATAAAVVIPVDDHCHIKSKARVVDDWDAMLNQTNIGANNNKF